ncbi:phosphoenolpyruvate--protein phosphotransferase [Paenibacillus hemerocallicola]|uniref:Phosphoenolpyruvate-protein phosphotransferase n=1 Tax=Paenibacillus hemerocallicola TaxID=1172614 RepID=A0A5C4THG9_9BACL|nr:phosphoenolpyruvate--protein phosphotransferase [Paenibacillus hemerocallicola]TNJ67869.1 phosphoenolpyruvate--protein phosphotransferase [Paenibacillus hemerocallicola]
MAQISSVRLQGIGASEGISIAPVTIFCKDKIQVQLRKIDDAESEYERLDKAIAECYADLQAVHAEAGKRLGPEEAKIFEGHLSLLQDPSLRKKVTQLIEREKANAEYALEQHFDTIIAKFEKMKNEYMREREADVRDVKERLLKKLLGIADQSFPEQSLKVRSILVAHDLTPADTTSLTVGSTAGFATEIGGKTSHTAIIARSLNIPSVVGVSGLTNAVNPGDTIIVDGREGVVIVRPTEEEIAKYESKREQYEAEKTALASLIHEPSLTKDGRKIEIAANIGSPLDADAAIAVGAEGIGLFRTEFLYMNRSSLPDEEEQFEAYRTAVERMSPKPVVIRTLDIGGDKSLPYLPMDPEMNPFLGHRAIRLCLERPDLFRPQIRAILRAGEYGNVHMMFPMVATMTELRQAKEMVDEEKAKLRTEGTPFSDHIPVGIMVEIPSTALIADQLAKEADFFSIGTNDLIQYTLACDRMNEKISHLYQPFHPAVLRLIQMTADAAHRENKWVGVCGEMAGDVQAIPLLVGLGIDELSMSASSVLKARHLVQGMDYVELRELARNALQLDTQEEVLRLLERSRRNRNA